MRSGLLCALWLGCGEDPPEATERAWCVDYDRDGSCPPSDCNDADWRIEPAAQEIWYDGVDQDCRGDDDFDADRDGFQKGEPLVFSWGYVLQDCDDDNPSAHPALEPQCGNGFDDDCNGRDDCSRQGSWSSGDLVSARLIGGAYLEGPYTVPDFDGDGVPEWYIDNYEYDSVVVPFFEGDQVLEDVEWLQLPPAYLLALGNFGGESGDDLLVATGADVIAYPDPELGLAGYRIPGVVDALAVGDVTSDGVGDVVTGASSGLRTTLVYAGPILRDVVEGDQVAEIISFADATALNNGTVGESTLAGGDLTGDGWVDLAFTLNGPDDTTSFGIAPGPVRGTLVAGDVPNVVLDPKVPTVLLDTAHDWNQDGYLDVVAERGAGTEVYHGPFLEDRPIDSWDAVVGAGGTATSGHVGSRLRPAGDVNGDTCPDLYTVGLRMIGFTYGPFLGVFPDYLGDDLTVSSPNGDVTSASPVGDSDADGADDILLAVICQSPLCPEGVQLIEFLPGFVAFGY